MDQPLTTLQQYQSGASAPCGIAGIPWPGGRDDQPVLENVPHDIVPLFDPGRPPRLPRYLALINGEAVPQQVNVRGGKPARITRPGATVQVSIEPTREGSTPYVHREDRCVIAVNGRRVGLRLGLENRGSVAWWNWTRAERTFAGRVADLWRVGGHIPVDPLDRDLPQPTADRYGQSMYSRMSSLCGRVIAADVFLIVFHGGVIKLHAHFKNNLFHVPPEDLDGLPLVQLSDVNVGFGSHDLDGTQTSFRGRDAVDLSECAGFFGEENRGLLRTDGDTLTLRPFERIAPVAHKTADNELYRLGDPEKNGLPAGCARSVRFSVALDQPSATIARFMAQPEWYGRCGSITGAPWDAPTPGPAHRFSAESRDLLYDSVHHGSFDAGRTWRYLRRDLRTGTPQIDDAEWEGTLAQALAVDAYLRPEQADWGKILDIAYHVADVGVDHGRGMLRCHGHYNEHYPLPMMRLGGMVSGYQETGDPYLLETACMLADTFMWMDQTNQPRYSIGRDAFPLVGLMSLFDATGDVRYLDFGRQLVTRALACQSEEGGFSRQGGTGPVSGHCNLDNPRTIKFGSGLLTPIAILEWARRDDRHPADFARRMEAWLDLVLASQSPDGTWHVRRKDGSEESYPLTAGGLLGSLALHAMVTGQTRGLQAMQRYLEQALASDERVRGTHAFLPVLYASVFEQACQLLQRADATPFKHELS